MQLRDVLNNLETSIEKSAALNSGGTPPATKKGLTKSASSTESLALSLSSGIEGLLTKLAQSEEEDVMDTTESEEKESSSDGSSEEEEEGASEEGASTEESKDDSESNDNISQEDIKMLQHLASKGILQKFAQEQVLDHELSKEAGYNLALETVARIIEQVGGSIEKSANVAGYSESIHACIQHGHLTHTGGELLKTAADTQIAQSYLDTLVSRGELTAEGQALILNSLAQVPDINEETIAQAVAGLDPQQAAAAQQALMDQFIQRNTTPAPAGVPMMPAEQPQMPVAMGAMGDPSLATAPVMPDSVPAEMQEKAAAWDTYSQGLIEEAAAFEKLASQHPELWSMVELEKAASVKDPIAEYYANFLQKKGL